MYDFFSGIERPVLIATLLVVWMLAGWLIYKILRRRSVMSYAIAGAVFIGLLPAVLACNQVGDMYDSARLNIARLDGFDSWQAYQVAVSAGFQTKLSYDRYLQDKAENARKERERIARESAEKKRLEQAKMAGEKKVKEEACRKDFNCWAERMRLQATMDCQKAVEQQARYDFEWTDSWYEFKFPGMTPSSQPRVAHYGGDQLKLQNKFGAWSNYKYICSYHIDNKQVLHVELQPGRF